MGRVGSWFLLVVFAAQAWVQGADTEAKSPVAPSAGPIPAEFLFRNAALRLPLINPSGNRLAAIFDTDEDQTGLLIYDLKEKKAERLLGSKGRDTTAVDWLGDDGLLTNQTREKIYADGLHYVNAKRPAKNHPILVDSAASFLGTPVDRPLEPYVWIYSDAYNEGKDYGPVQLDARTNVNNGGMGAQTSKEDFIASNGTAAAILRPSTALKEGIPIAYVVNRFGHLAYARASVEGVTFLYYLRNKAWQRSPISMGDYGFIGDGDEEGEVIVVGRYEQQKPYALLRMDVATGAVRGVLYQDSQYDPIDAQLYRHPTTQRIIGIGFIRSFHENIWFEPVMQEAQVKLQKQIPGTAFNVLGYDREMKSLVVAAYSDRVPVVYLLYDVASGNITSIASTRPGAEKFVMQPMQLLKYKARDGFRIEAYLTLPAGASKEAPAPLIVMPHGGPHARDYLTWNPEVQFFASRGYAVLQPNYRGSNGTFWQYPDTDFWNLRKMHDDVTDGVTKVIQSGLVDPRRVAIVGTSFGGYLALTGVAWEKNIYRCAVSIAGVSNWASLVNDRKAERYTDSRYESLIRILGLPEKNVDAYRAISPIFDVDRVQVPILVAHGKEDRVVPLSQSKELVAALAHAGKPHRKWFRNEEGHGMFNLGNQVALYTQIEGFLAENMK